MAENPYNHLEIEKKWQKRWADEGVFTTPDIPSNPKAYVLDMFPYPSGEGLHVGHPKGYIATDIYSRMKMMQGYDVLHPMGWDAFGLPAENYAIKNKVHPRVAVEKNIARFKEQLSKIGFTYDWGREINTTDPAYYKWTQWIFLQLYKKGLAYESFEPINWCPSCQTGLANEDLDGGVCERCGSVVEKRPMRQWVLKITDYAEQLLSGLETLPWPKSIKESQRNWIGKSEGAEIPFEVRGPWNFVLLHGYTASPEADFHPWLKNGLEQRGYKVQTPTLPHSDNPVVSDQVEYVLQNVSIDEHTVILGHSLGAVIAMKVVEKLDHPIARLILAAGFMEPKFLDHSRPFESSFDWKFDEEAIKKNARSIAILRASNDTAVPQEQGDMLHTKLGGVMTHVEAQEDHFCGKQEIAILSACIPIVPVFTTRADTLFGVTYLVLAPEHSLVQQILFVVENKNDVEKYISEAVKKTEIDRTAEGKEKTGVCMEGMNAVNPATGETIPVWVADYVLVHYGTGAVMAVPAHDTRDMEFAQKYDLPIVPVVGDDGILIHSGDFTGISSEEAKEKITKAYGKKNIQYKLRDWVFSRQRYWGEPIPVIHCETCGIVPVPEDQLPVLLPEVEHYEPSGTGESPLADIAEWVNTTCPTCNGPAKRETNTMPQWAGSSWYYLRFIDPENTEALVDPKKEQAWMNVDLYVGGAEHATRHLIYARFWHIVLHELGLVSTPEPFGRLEHVGLILAEDGRKMSKRWGNVVNPDEIVTVAGADTLRLYEMFMGPFNQAVAWSTAGIAGPRRFIERVWRLSAKVAEKEDSAELISSLHRTIRRVSEDTQAFRFNTAIAALMECLNAMEKERGVSKKTFETFLLLLAPYAPHVCEELWEQIGNTGVISRHAWPKFDENLAVQKTVSIAVQVNGKVRGELTIAVDASQEEVEKEARALENVKKYLAESEVRNVIYVPGRLLNFVCS